MDNIFFTDALTGKTDDELIQMSIDASNSYVRRCEMLEGADAEDLIEIFGTDELKNINKLQLDALIELRNQAFEMVPDGVGGRFLNKMINDIRITRDAIGIIAERRGVTLIH